MANGETTYLSASLLLWMGTLTGRLVASRKSVIRLRWMISGCTGRTSTVEEEREERREEEEEELEGQLRGEEGEEEHEDEGECVRREGRRSGRRRNSNMSFTAG